jgi:hypothetical protein
MLGNGSGNTPVARQCSNERVFATRGAGEAVVSTRSDARRAVTLQWNT